MIARALTALTVLMLSACGERAAPAPGHFSGRAVAFAQPESVWDKQWQGVAAHLDQFDDVSLEFFTRGERGGEEQMLYDLRRGRAHMGGLSLQGLASTVPELNIAMAPYVFESAEEVDFVYDNYLFEVFDDLFASKNLKILQWVEVGWNGIYSQAPIRVPADARGMRLRGSPNPAAQLFLEAIGADSIPLGSSDLVPSLQTGLIEGGVSAVIFHFFTTRRYAPSLTLSQHAYDTGAVVVNRAWWDSATPRQQRILQEGWGSSAQARSGVRSLVAGAMAKMREEGIAVQALSDTELAQWRAVTDHIVPTLIERIGGESQRVADAIAAGRAAFRAAQ
ncbi:MAG: TRAP transporter substrate-binding protein DctP [Pseudomonadota bacterium]